MNIRSKKIIAREFLVLMVCLCISILTFASIYTYNFFRHSQISSLNKQITASRNLKEELIKSHSEKEAKQIWFVNQYLSEFDLPGDDRRYSNISIWETLNRVIRRDSVKIKWETSWKEHLVPFNKKMGFHTPEAFQSFVLATTINAEDEKKKKLSIREAKRIETWSLDTKNLKKKILGPNDRNRISIWSLTLSLTMLFGFRYLYYAIIWSIVILKQQ